MNFKKEGVTIETINQLLKTSLTKYFNKDKIAFTPTGVIVKGDLKSIWERAVTKAEARLKIDGNQLSYRVDGTSSLGVWPWIWGVLGFFTYGFLCIWFFWALVEYILCRDRPKRYIEEAFKAVQFEIG